MKKKPPQPQNNAQGIQQQSEQQAPAQNTRYMTSDEISIEIQKTKLNIEKSTLIFNKGILLYFSFLFVGIFGFVQGYVSETTLNLLIVLGIMAFIVGAIPYLKTTKQEEKKLTEILEHIKGKRGISPLIATVILIGFAVALGAVVMNWSKAQLNTSGCEKVEIDFEKVAGVAQFCQTNDGKLQYEIVNKGKVQLVGLKTIFFGGSNQEARETKLSIGIAETGIISQEMPLSAGIIRRVKIIPMIAKGTNDVEYCIDNAITVQNAIPYCG